MVPLRTADLWGQPSSAEPKYRGVGTSTDRRSSGEDGSGGQTDGNPGRKVGVGVREKGSSGWLLVLLRVNVGGGSVTVVTHVTNPFTVLMIPTGVVFRPHSFLTSTTAILVEAVWICIGANRPKPFITESRPN